MLMGGKAVRAVLAIALTCGVAAAEQRVQLRISGSCSGDLLLYRCVGGLCTELTGRSPLREGSATLTLPDASRHRVELESNNCWLAPLDVGADTAESIEIRAWPPAALTGIATTHDKGDVTALDAHLKIDGVEREAKVRCQVEQSKWRCPIPAAPLQARIEAAGYAPRHVWDIAARPSSVYDAGTIEFVRGATVAGMLDPGSVAPEVTIELHVDGKGEKQPLFRLRPVKGHFEFAGVMPGAYRVIARARDVSPARSETLIVSASSFYRVAPLRFDALATVKIAVDPPVDSLQRPWNIAISHITPGTPHTTPVVRDSVPLTGWWEKPGIETGRYVIAISDASGAIVHRVQMQIDENGPVIEVRIAQIPVRGRVSVGGAELTFTSVGIQGGKRVQFTASEEGEFSGMLPHEGTWDVKIALRDEKAYVVRRGVNVKRPADADVAYIELELPPGKIEGTVFDGAGEPLTEMSSIMLVRNGKPEANTVSGDEGQFAFFGLAEGDVMLRAVTASGGDTGLIPARVRNSGTSRIRLTMAQGRRVQGTLVTSNGLPIAGAYIRYLAPAMPTFLQTVTDASGIFELRLPHGVGTIAVAVLASALPVSLSTVEVSADRILHLVVPTDRGELFIPMSRRAEPPLIASLNGIPLPVRTLVFPMDGSALPRGVQPDGFLITLVPGAYTFCSGGCQTVTIRSGERTVARPDEQ